MNYPKALYKGAQYSDWQTLCADLHAKRIEMVTVAHEDEEKEARADGFVDAAALMIVRENTTIKAAIAAAFSPPASATDAPTASIFQRARARFGKQEGS